MPSASCSGGCLSACSPPRAVTSDPHALGTARRHCRHIVSSLSSKLRRSQANAAAAKAARGHHLLRCRAADTVATPQLTDRAAPAAAGSALTAFAPSPDSSQLSHLEGLLRVIGVGPRGAAAVERLLGDSRLRGVDLWVVDEARHPMPGATAVALHPNRAQ